jgi:hypothetical protein
MMDHQPAAGGLPRRWRRKKCGSEEDIDTDARQQRRFRGSSWARLLRDKEEARGPAPRQPQQG